MFDLPVVTFENKRQASAFRHFLLDEGFEMAQFSVYFRHCAGPAIVDRRMETIRRRLPPDGSIKLLVITDKQYANIKTYWSQSIIPNKDQPQALQLW
jgi:CRISPR-associated protein Cas2